MDESEREDFLAIIAQYGLSEEDFEIKEETSYPPAGIGSLSGTLTIKYRPSAIEKSYRHFNHPWLHEFENDLKSNLYRNKK